jgi:hypothetical protein
MMVPTVIATPARIPNTPVRTSSLAWRSRRSSGGCSDSAGASCVDLVESSTNDPGPATSEAPQSAHAAMWSRYSAWDPDVARCRQLALGQYFISVDACRIWLCIRRRPWPHSCSRPPNLPTSSSESRAQLYFRQLRHLLRGDERAGLVPPEVDEPLRPEVLLNDDHRICALVRRIKPDPLVVKVGAKGEDVLRERSRVVNRLDKEKIDSIVTRADKKPGVCAIDVLQPCDHFIVSVARDAERPRNLGYATRSGLLAR